MTSLLQNHPKGRGKVIFVSEQVHHLSPPRPANSVQLKFSHLAQLARFSSTSRETTAPAPAAAPLVPTSESDTSFLPAKPLLHTVLISHSSQPGRALTSGSESGNTSAPPSSLRAKNQHCTGRFLMTGLYFKHLNIRLDHRKLNTCT